MLAAARRSFTAPTMLFAASPPNPSIDRALLAASLGMHRGRRRFAQLLISLLPGAACAPPAHLSVADGTGPRAAIPPRREGLVPTVNYVKAKGWPSGSSPVPAAGLA